MLFFSNDEYKNVALSISDNDMNMNSCIDAFFVLIRGLNYNDLDVLCSKVIEVYGVVSKEECYKLIQSDNIPEDFKKCVYACAEQIINDGNFLGTMISNGFNTSSWINHSYYVGECCSNLANILGINSDKAMTYGMLHDIGRKKSFCFDHAIYGFEYLLSIGYIDEAVGCLTHSFVNGGRCSNNERAIEGFYVDEDGNARFMEGSAKDDITLFLEQYRYNDYDLILNIADLMAVNKGIVSPYDRIIKDIAQRRDLDPVNRGYFLADITNVFIDFLKRIGYSDRTFNYIRADKNTSLVEIENYFKEVSEYFYEVYSDIINKNKRNNR